MHLLVALKLCPKVSKVQQRDNIKTLFRTHKKPAEVCYIEVLLRYYIFDGNQFIVKYLPVRKTNIRIISIFSIGYKICK